MIVTRSPLRITLGGGGSDLQPGGLCIAAAIDKYVTIAVSETFEDRYILRYSETERARELPDISHRLLKACLKVTDTPPGIEIVSTADIPSGTGLGSSGAFTVGVLKALCPEMSKPELARVACQIDIGQQDQWAAVYGGVNVFDFAAQSVRPIETRINRHLALFYTGTRRGPADLPQPRLRGRVDRELAALEQDDPEALGWCLSSHWAAKLRAAPTTEHLRYDSLISDGIAAGAFGGKLIGAGGGGFLLFATADRDKLIDAVPLRHVPFAFDQQGSVVL